MCVSSFVEKHRKAYLQASALARSVQALRSAGRAARGERRAAGRLARLSERCAEERLRSRKASDEPNNNSDIINTIQ